MIEYWFRPKSYGYGATPINWKGWASSLVAAVALLAVLLLFVLPAPGGAPRSILETGLGMALALAVVVVFSAFAKTRTSGEWRWRWGKDSNGSF
jgi:flagellar biosynthesis component FlhA